VRRLSRDSKGFRALDTAYEAGAVSETIGLNTQP
jgi:hypothetical protein